MRNLLEKRFRWLGVAGMVATIAACSEGDPERTCPIAAPGVETVRIDASALEGAPRSTLAELWRAGGLDDDAAELTQPATVRVGPDGTLAIPDFSAATTWLLAADGRWLDPVGNRGEGPGEVLNPIAATWNEKGHLVVFDAGQSRIVTYDLESGTSETEPISDKLIRPVFMYGEVGWFGLRSDGTLFMEHPATLAEDGSGEVTFYRAGPNDDSPRLAWRSSYPAGFVPDYGRAPPPRGRGRF